MSEFGTIFTGPMPVTYAQPPRGPQDTRTGGPSGPTSSGPSAVNGITPVELPSGMKRPAGIRGDLVGPIGPRPSEGFDPRSLTREVGPIPHSTLPGYEAELKRRALINLLYGVNAGEGSY